MREYGRLRQQADPANSYNPTPVPVENTGGPGTQDGNWRENVFADELLTGFLGGSVRPLSQLIVACFEDMGYQVDFAAADEYALPSMLRIAELGLWGTQHAIDTCAIEPVKPETVPEEDIINST